jgi:outer membrane receptor for ferrienterochelin and colicins
MKPDSVLTTEYGRIINDRNSDGSRKKLPDGFKTSINDISIRGRISKDGFTVGFNVWDKKEGLGSEVVGYEYFTNTDDIDYMVHHSAKSIFTQYDTEFSEDVQSNSKFIFRNSTVEPSTGFVYTNKYQSVDNGIDPKVNDKKKSYFGEGFLTRFEQQFIIELFDFNTLIAGFHVESQVKEYFGISLGEEQSGYSTIIPSTFEDESQTVSPMYFSRNMSIFAQDEIRFLDNYAFTGGLRYDYDTDYGSL